jgi:hypothetical protein
MRRKKELGGAVTGGKVLKYFTMCVSIFLLLFTREVLAQKDCGDGLPCGKLPWDLPSLPIMVSPTRMPTFVATAAPTSTPQPSATSGPSPTPQATGTVLNDFAGLGDQLSTLTSQINATDVPIEINGTPVDSGEQLATMSSGANTFFGYVRGFSELSLGGLTPFFTFAITSLVIIIAIKSLGFILPILAVVFGIILKVVQLAVQVIRG